MEKGKILETKLLENKKFLFITGPSGREEWMLKISEELSNRWKINFSFLSISSGGDIFLKLNGISNSKINSLVYDDTKAAAVNLDVEYICSAERKYGFKVWDIWQISAPRKKKRMSYSDKRVLSWVQYYIQGMEELLDKGKFDYVVFHGVASFFMVIIYKMLQYYNIEILQLIDSRISKRFTLTNNVEDKWPLLLLEYHRIQKEGISSDEKEEASSFIENFRLNKPRPDGYISGHKESMVSKVKKYAEYMKVFRYRRSLPDFKMILFWPILDKIKKLNWKLFEQPVAGEKYVFYPLHVDPEMSTSLMGKWYINQLSLIDNIAKSLPCNYKLYVKEHKRNFSSRPSYYHDEIKKNPNVRLISPDADSFEIIKQCSLVLTITGTAGWEAVLFQKPVIVFGEIYYSNFSEVSKAGKLADLSNLIGSKIGKKIDRKKTEEFVAALLAASFKGSAACPTDCNGKSLSVENINLLVNGIENYLFRKNKLSTTLINKEKNKTNK